MRKLRLVFLLGYLVFLVPASRSQVVSNPSGRSADSTFQARMDSLNTLRSPNSRSSKMYLEDDFAFGGTIGTPGGLNIISEKYFNRIGIRAEFGAFGLVPFWGIAGYQADLSYVILRSKHELLECTLFYYNSFLEGADMPVISLNRNSGVAVSFNGKGFFVQIGFTPSFFKQFSSADPWPSLFQIGYVN